MASGLIGGRVYRAIAGVCAFAALLSSNKFVRDAALGNSDPMLGGIVLWAFERHLDEQRDHALYLGVIAALMRPEAWPFLGLYGLWLWFTDPHLRKQLVGVRGADPVRLVPARVVGLRRPAAGRLARERAQPRQRRVRRHPRSPWRTAAVQVTIAPVEARHARLRSATRPSCGAAMAHELETIALAVLGFAWLPGRGGHDAGGLRG